MGVGLPLAGVAGQQAGGEQGEGGQQHLAGEQKVCDERAGHGQNGNRDVEPGAEGIDRQDGEQGGHGEVQPCEVQGDDRSQRGTGGRAGHPVGRAAPGPVPVGPLTLL
jgi:hypothetical protein